MKKKLSILKYILPGLFLFASCDDFLEEASQDLIRPNTVAHYQELLVGEGYFHNLMKNGWFVELMTDNIELFENSADDVNLLPAEVKSGEDCYLWKKEIEDKLGPDGLYKHLYGNILAANTCLLDLDKMEGSLEDKNLLRGQASFMRAYGYFALSNLYAQAYNEADVENDLCVPLYLEAKPTLEKFKRNTIKEVWGQIKLDAGNAVESLEKVDRLISVYEVNYNAALLLASRVALFMGEYDEVISYGEKFLNINPALYDISEGLIDDKTGFLDPVTNPEVVFNFGSNYEYNFIYESTGFSQFTFRVYNTNDQSLMTHYSNGDGRKEAFFEAPVISWLSYFNHETWLPKKYDRYDKTGLRQAFRSAEVYLMMAEAYARKENLDNGKAISYLNQLRSKRIKDYTNLTEADFGTQEELIKFIWDERRRELCFEEFHRWWDLRRIGQPSIKHNWKGGKIYELTEKDPAYILNFPMAERNFNSALEINPRSDREAIN